MAKLVIKNDPTPSITSNSKTITVKVDKLSIGDSVVLVSKSDGNIISTKTDGIYATIDKPNDILSFIAAMDAALN